MTRIPKLVVGLVVSLAAAFDGGCGHTEPSPGSETNWMVRCSTNAECQADSACICGVCTSSCSIADPCPGAPQRACAPTGSAAERAQCANAAGPSGGLCLPVCSADKPCGAGRCIEGSCVVEGASDDSPSAAGGSSGGLAPSADASELARVYCAATRECCKREGYDPAAIADCEAGLLEIESLRHVQNGTIVFDPQVFSACLQAFEAASQSCTSAQSATACKHLFQGTIADGRACSDAWECTSENAVCFSRENEPGVCRPTAAGTLGAACDRTCAPGDDCASTWSWVKGSPEPTFTICYEADGLTCASSGVCERLRAEGEACSADGECATTHVCAGTCQKRSSGADSFANARLCGGRYD